MQRSELPTQPPPAKRPTSTAASLIAGSAGGMCQVIAATRSTSSRRARSSPSPGSSRARWTLRSRRCARRASSRSTRAGSCSLRIGRVCKLNSPHVHARRRHSALGRHRRRQLAPLRRQHGCTSPAVPLPGSAVDLADCGSRFDGGCGPGCPREPSRDVQGAAAGAVRHKPQAPEGHCRRDVLQVRLEKRDHAWVLGASLPLSSRVTRAHAADLEEARRRSRSSARFPPTPVSLLARLIRNSEAILTPRRSAGFYAGYESSKRALQKKLDTPSLPVWATLTAGGIGGLGYWLAWCARFPFPPE